MLTWILVVWLLNSATGRVEIKAITYPTLESCQKGQTGMTSSEKYVVKARSQCWGVPGRTE